MRPALIAGVVFAAALAGQAHATVVYSLTDQAYAGESAARGASLRVSLTLGDSAVQRGGFNMHESALVPGAIAVTGDTADFINLQRVVGPVDTGVLTPTLGYYTRFDVALTFSNSVPSGTLRLSGETSEFYLSGIAGKFSGTLASDFNNCNLQGQSRCTVSGRLAEASVPEPASLALLGAGLFGLALTRRKRS